MYLNFMFLGQFLFEYIVPKTHTHGNTNTYTDTHKDSDKYSIVVFCKNSTIKICTLF